MQSLPYPQYHLEEIWKEGQTLAWDTIEEEARQNIKYLIDNVIQSELELFIGCSSYERTEGRKDYRNGYYERSVATTLGEIPIRFPRMRYSSFQSQFIGKYERRRQEVDYAVLSCFILGGSVRKTKKICDLFIDVQISPSTVSKIAKELEEKAREFHLQPITQKYRFLLLDGLWIHINAHLKKHVFLFVMGITYEGKKEVIDFMLADGESEEAYSTLLNHLLKRGLDTSCLDLIIHDGAKGIEAALNMCLPFTPRQACVFHKLQGASSKIIHLSNREEIMKDASNIYDRARTRAEAIALLKAFSRKWIKTEPWVVRHLTRGFDKTLTYFNFPLALKPLISTSNPLERYLREIRRRIRPMGPFKNEKSANRIVYALVYTLNTGDIPGEFTQHS